MIAYARNNAVEHEDANGNKEEARFTHRSSAGLASNSDGCIFARCKR